MKNILTTFFFLSITLATIAQNYSVRQTILYGGSGDDDISEVIQTSDGNFVLIGTTNSTNNIYTTNHGHYDILVQKIDLNGVVIWTKLIGGSGIDEGVGIIELGNGDLVLTGNTSSFNGDFSDRNTSSFYGNAGVVIKLSGTDQSILWIDYENSQNSSPYSVAFNREVKNLIRASNGDILVLYRYRWYTFYPVVKRFNSAGVVLWTMNDFFDYPPSQQVLSLNDLTEITNGDICLIGNYTSNGSNPTSGKDISLVKLSSSGSLKWRKNFPAPFEEDAHHILSEGTDLFYTGYQTSYTKVPFITKIDSAGQQYWKHEATTTGTHFNFISKDNTGNIISGSERYGNEGLIRISPYGTIINSQSVPDNSQTLTFSNASYYSNNKFYHFLDNRITDNYINTSGTPRDYGMLVLDEQKPIKINELSVKKYCVYNQIPVSFSSNLPLGTSYIIKLKRGNISYLNYTTTSLNYQLYLQNSLIPADDYYIEVSSGVNVDTSEHNISIGTIYSTNISDEDAYNYSYQNIQLCNGASKKFSSQLNGYNLSGVAALTTYSWLKNNTPISSSDTSKITFDSDGEYKLNVVQGGCNFTSAPVYLTFASYINTSISSPFEKVTCNGGNAIFSTNYKTTTSNYIWQKNGVDIPNSNLNVFHATTSGLYSVRIEDLTCNNTSPKVRASFKDGLEVTFYVNNNDTTLCGVNNYKTLFASTYGNNLSPVNYQWQLNGFDIPGAIYQSYVTNIPGNYRLKVTQETCTSFSQERTLIHSSKAQKPIILSTYDSLCTATIIITQPKFYIGKDRYNSSYRNGYWYKDNNKIYNYETSSLSTATSGTYKMVVSEGTSCENESDPISLSFGILEKPKVKTQNGDLDICGTNESIYTYVDLTNLHGTFSFQWKKNGVNILNSNRNYISINTPGEYSVVLTNGSCSSESAPISITQNSVTPILITDDSELFCSNRSTKIQARGFYNWDNFHEIVTWRKSGIVIPNENSDFIYVTEPGNYTAEVNSNGCVGITTPISIESGPPTGFYAEAFDTVQEGQNASITISSCSGQVKWYYDATSANLLFTGATFNTPSLSQNTSYWVSCTKEYCESQRVEIFVSVATTGCPEIITHDTLINGQEYLAVQTITSSIDIPTGVKYSAGNHIILSPGFSAGSNEVFEAIIGGCQN